MLRSWLCLMVCTIVVALAPTVFAQPPQTDDSKATAPLGVDKFYFELTKSKDNSTRVTAERYVALVKVQEWSDLSGKFKAIAHYVKHEPNLSTVTIAIMKGAGSDRTSDEKTVPVDKLSKTCQVRVKQIDLLQKKLKEMSKSGTNGSPGAPMADDRGAGAEVKGPEAGPGAPPAAVGPDPSASEPDPLGFAEVQLAPVSGGRPGAIPPAGPDGGPGSIPGGPPTNPDPGPGGTPASPPTGRPS